MIFERHLTARPVAGSVLLAATETAGRIWASFLSGADPQAVADHFGADCMSLRQIGGGLLAELTPDAVAAEDAEDTLLQGRNVILAVRACETAEAVADWLTYHCKTANVDGALIVDRAGPEQAEVLCNELARFDIPIVLVRANIPLGRPSHPAVSDPALAPGAPARVRDDAGPHDPWLAPLGETILLETLRRRWLGAARAVAFLDVSDLLCVGADDPFARAAANPGAVVPLLGRELYPWRLRQDQPAGHLDCICGRLNETRAVSRWCIAPGASDNDLYWRLIRVGGASADGPPVPFLRAMGVAFPGANPSKLVAKSDLVEDAEAIHTLSRAFGADPVRMPVADVSALSSAAGRRVTVITAMKNEGPYIVDWIAHNRAIGIDNFLVYTNDCSDGTERVLDALAQQGILQRRDNPYRKMKGVPQHSAFRAAEDEDIVKNSDWLITMDVDEYINIHRGRGHIDDLFDAVPDANLISMPWRLFGNADLHRFDPGPVTHQFHRCAQAFSPKPHQAWGFKTLFRNAGLFRRLSVHRPRGMEPQAIEVINWVNGSGQPLPQQMWQSAWRMGKASWGYDLVSLNHYAVRSAESFLIKRDRGRVNHTTRDQGYAYWFRMNHNAVEDHSIRRLDSMVAEERSRLMSLPGVQAAHDASVTWHQARITELKAMPGFREVYETITGPRMEKLSRLLNHFGTNVFLAGPHVIPDEIVAKDASEDFFFTIQREAAD